MIAKGFTPEKGAKGFVIMSEPKHVVVGRGVRGSGEVAGGRTG
jgi:hypothetical protein